VLGSAWVGAGCSWDALGLAVKTRRKEFGFTQEELSLRAQLHQRWISNIETGKRNPSYTSIRRLAAGLDLTASELIARAEQIEHAEDTANQPGSISPPPEP
jgi:transcriptional regulator with XRE-family HTH domain